MLPEAGATELIFLAAVALIVVGPKDLPVLMRKVGQWVGKMRSLAAEFRSSFDELARQSELDELRKEVEALRNTRLPDPMSDVHPTFEEIGASLDPHAYAIADQSSPSAPPDEAAAPAAVAKPRARRKKSEVPAAEPEAPAKTKRAPARPKAAASAKPAAVKPRAKRAVSAEAEG